MKRVAAYVRVEEASEAPLHTASGASQVLAIEGWARTQDASVVFTGVDRALSGIDHVGDRVGFLACLTRVRDGECDVLAVASLSHLDNDLVVQELLLADAWGSGVDVASAALEPYLLEPDPRRALVRRVIAEAPEFAGQMRSLRAWVRRNEIADGFERLGPALAELEAIQEHRQAGATETFSERHRIARMLRAMRFGT